MQEFYTQYKRPAQYAELHIDEGKVERLGYQETADIVNQFMMAGEKLRMFRGGMYGPDEEIPEDAPADRYMDETDAILEMRNVNQRMQERIHRSKEKNENMAKERMAAEKDGGPEAASGN